MSRPTHILKHEHRVIERGLRALDGMCLTLKVGGTVPPDALAQVLDFIHNFADRFHHSREEDLFFPVLKQFGLQEDGGALGFLRREHEVEREMLTELEMSVEEYRYGDDAASQRFVRAAEQFRDLLIGHMQREDTILFPLAEEMIAEIAKVKLIEQLNCAEEHNETLRRKYEELAAELEKQWSR
jgi:hemerythrin-like domain-containing protein